MEAPFLAAAWLVEKEGVFEAWGLYLSAGSAWVVEGGRLPHGGVPGGVAQLL